MITAQNQIFHPMAGSEPALLGGVGNDRPSKRTT